MSRIKSKNTLPEIYVRSALRKAGYRFDVNGKVSKRYQQNGILPGKPDIVMPQHRIVVFIHGCFWHAHKKCKRAMMPKTNTQYWRKKLAYNIIHDKKNIASVSKLGWKSYVIWECEIKNAKAMNRLMKKIENNDTRTR